MRATETNRAHDWIEQTTTRLVRNHDLIAIEDLNITGVTRSARGTAENPGTNVAQKRGLNRAISQQRWGRWETRLNQKAETCGVHVIAVPAANTSITCNTCGHKAKEYRESQAVFTCTNCGCKNG